MLLQKLKQQDIKTTNIVISWRFHKCSHYEDKMSSFTPFTGYSSRRNKSLCRTPEAVSFHSYPLCQCLSFLVKFIKVHPTPKFFCQPPNNYFVSDGVAEEIIVIRYFLNFLWFFKILKISTTLVDHWVPRRLGPCKSGLSHQLGKWFSLRDAKRPKRGRNVCLDYVQWLCCCKLTFLLILNDFFAWRSN